MDIRNNKRRNVSTHARVNFSQSETSSFLRVGELNFELLLLGGDWVNRKDPLKIYCNKYIKYYYFQSGKIYLIINETRVDHPGITQGILNKTGMGYREPAMT